MKYFISLTLAMTLLASCTCKPQGIKIVEQIEASDRFASCSRLKQKILETEATLESAKSQQEYLEAYAGNPVCLLPTQFDIEKSINSNQNRLKYLHSLAVSKGCEPPPPPPVKVEPVVITPVEKAFPAVHAPAPVIIPKEISDPKPTNKTSKK